MKKIAKYVCDFCLKEYNTREEAEECELGHMELEKCRIIDASPNFANITIRFSNGKTMEFQKREFEF